MSNISKMTLHHLLNAIEQVEEFARDIVEKPEDVPRDEEGYNEYAERYNRYWENIRMVKQFLQEQLENTDEH